MLAAIVLLGAGCAYFNTFYNAKAAYREGMKLKEQNQNSQAKAKFDKAIEKSALLIQHQAEFIGPAAQDITEEPGQGFLLVLPLPHRLSRLIRFLLVASFEFRDRGSTR